MRLCQRSPVKDVHLVVGVLSIALHGAAGLYGAWCWWGARSSGWFGGGARSSVWFWRGLRAGQAVVVAQVALGGVLVLLGRKPPGLHVLYGVLPLLISVMAEQLRAASAQMVLDTRGYESAREVGKLPEDEQRGIVVAIMQRELGVMTIAA